MMRMESIADTAMDQSSAADNFASPGNDTRQWISYGIVNPDIQGGNHSVRFKDDSGSPLPQGVLVDVTLQPSGIIVPCRVAGHVAGSGEAEYSPFGPGDEVIVAVPEGNERAGCVIIGRLTNVSDTFPTTVAGNDITNNNVSFKRSTLPFIHEVGSTWMARSANTGASLTIGIDGSSPGSLTGGAVILSDGSTNALIMSPSAILLQEATGVALLQIDPSKLQVALQSGGGTQLLLDGSSSHFLTKGTMTILTSGAVSGGHAVTVEQVLMLIEGFMSAWSVPLGALVLPVVGGGGGTVPLLPLAATITPILLKALMATGIAAASANVLGPELAALNTAMAIPPAPGVPGVGCAGLIIR